MTAMHAFPRQARTAAFGQFCLQGLPRRVKTELVEIPMRTGIVLLLGWTG